MNTLQNEAAKLDRLLRRVEAAKYVTDTYGFPCSPRTLAKLACVSSQGRLFGSLDGYCSTQLPVLTPGRKARSGLWCD